MRFEKLIRSVGPRNVRLLQAIFGAAAGTFFVRMAQVVRELVFAYEFGVNRNLDILLLALALPTYLGQAMLGAIPASLIPAAVAERESSGDESMLRLVSSFGCLLLSVLTILAIGSTVAGPIYLTIVGHKLSPNELDFGFKLLLLLTPFLLLRGIEIFWVSWLNLNGSFAIPAIVPCITPLIGAAALLIVGPDQGAYAVAIATSVGLAIECGFLGWIVRRSYIVPTWSWFGFSNSLRRTLRQYAPVMMGALLLSAIVLVDQRSAAQLGSGSISQLYFANLIVQLPLLLASSALSAALLPYVSESIANKKWSRLRRLLTVPIALIFLLGVLAGTILTLLAHLIVSLVLVRGAFSTIDVEGVAAILRTLSWQIPFFLGGQIAVQAISAMRRNEILLWGAIISLGLKIALNYFFVARMGLPGIGLSTTVVFAASMTFLLYHCHSWLSRVESATFYGKSFD